MFNDKRNWYIITSINVHIMGDTKSDKINNHLFYWLILPMATATLMLLSLSVAVQGQGFSSGYSSEFTLPAGMAVSLDPEQDGVVEPASKATIDDLLGVVVGGSDSVFAVTSGESNVQVVTSGLTNLLVTDENGDIEQGDFVTVSEINGIGMKADREHSKIIGTAQADFSDPSVRTVETEDGERRDAAVARIPVVIQVGGNPQAAEEDTPLPGVLQGFANELAGEPVAPARIIIALAVISGGIVGSMVLLYGAVSSTIISIGRNPLSDKSIYAGLARMVVISLGIILFSVALGYLIVVAG